MIEEDPNEKVGYHVGYEDEAINTTMCTEFQGTDGEVSCVYVIGLLGMATYQTHYSAMVNIVSNQTNTFLKAGKPIEAEMKEL